MQIAANASSGFNETNVTVCAWRGQYECMGGEKGAKATTNKVNGSCLWGRLVNAYFQLHVQNVILTLLCYACHLAYYLPHSPLPNLLQYICKLGFFKHIEEDKLRLC